jgi:hypothetical protein
MDRSENLILWIGTPCNPSDLGHIQALYNNRWNNTIKIAPDLDMEIDSKALGEDYKFFCQHYALYNRYSQRVQSFCI